MSKIKINKNLHFSVVTLEECDLKHFLDFWKEQYKLDTYDRDDYLAFVLTEGEITCEHVLRAATWKKGWKWDDKKIRLFGTWDESIKKWVRSLNWLNTIRIRKVDTFEFLDQLYEKGIFVSDIRIQTN